jgi:hypothetical protein
MRRITALDWQIVAAPAVVAVAAQIKRMIKKHKFIMMQEHRCVGCCIRCS